MAPSRSPLSASFTPRWTLARASSLERVDGGEDRVLHGGPARSVLSVPLERTLRLVSASKRAVGKRERVIRGAPFRKQPDRALQVRDGRVVEALGRGDAPQSELGCRLGCRLSNQCVEQTLALLEIAGVEERFRELHARRQIVRRGDQGLAEA